MREWTEKVGFRLMVLAFSVRDLLRPRRVILDEVGLESGHVVLDFGCGTGSYVFEAARIVGERGTVYALDRNPEAIRWVKRRAGRLHLTNVWLILSELETGLADGVVDVVLLYDVLHMLRRVEDVLAEFRRVLRPSGILSVCDHHMRSDTIVGRVTSGGRFVLSKQGRYTHNFIPRSV